MEGRCGLAPAMIPGLRDGIHGEGQGVKAGPSPRAKKAATLGARSPWLPRAAASLSCWLPGVSAPLGRWQAPHLREAAWEAARAIRLSVGG